VHKLVSVRPLGVPRALFFGLTLKTHDRTFVEKYLGPELFLSSARGGSHAQKKKH
jgi:hypothetical protein